MILTAIFSASIFSETKAQKLEALVKSESVKKIKSMIIKNQSLARASYGDDKDSLLIVALKSDRDYDVIKLLLDAGASPKAQNANGDTAVSVAAKLGADPKILDKLISYDTVLPFQRKSRILKKNSEGMSAYDYASKTGGGQMEVINRYLGLVDKSDVVKIEEPEEKAEIAESPVQEEPEKAEEPLREEAAVLDETVAEEAVAAAPTVAAITVPENGAALQEAAKKAAERAQKPSRRVYLFDGIEAFDTYAAVQEQKPSLIKDPDKAGKNGRTLLHKAASEDDAAAIALLRDSGANFNLADNEGYTPLMYAARFAKKPETVALIFSAGADAKAKNRFGLTAIEIAAADSKSPEIVGAILAKSQKADAKKAFVAAVGLGRPNPILQKFFDGGMSANTVYKGKSVLMYAAESNSHTDCIQFLLEKGADKSMLSSDWKDAYWFASQNPSLPKNDVYWSLNNPEKN